MDRYAAGDPTAFSELYDALAPRLYAFIMRSVHDSTRAEDLVQQTLLQMHCARGRFVKGSKVTPWAFAIIRRLFLDQARRKKLEWLSPDGSEPVEAPSHHPGPEEAAQARELEYLLRQELARLTPAQQAAVELVYYGQMTNAEAAETLGVTVASIKLRVQRASQAIRLAFAGEVSEGES